MRTETIHLPAGHPIGAWCHLAKNLYNYANFEIRQELIYNGKWLRYNEMNKMMKSATDEFNDYAKLPAQSAQSTLKLLDKNWKSFFTANKAWKSDPSGFTGCPKMPGYYDKNGESILIFTNQQCKIIDGKLRFPRCINLKIKTRLSDETDLREVRIVPRGAGYKVEIVYKEDDREVKNLNKKRVVGIDLGMVNIITMVNNIGEMPIAVKDDGRGVKSINQFYNKERSRLQVIYAKGEIKQSRRLDRLEWKRNNKVLDYMHKLSRFVIDWCVEHRIGKIIIGRNKGWKQFINKGKRTNQNFVMIPYYILINQVKYKSEPHGIEVLDPEESYTSKVSFLDDEKLCHHEVYLGRRTKRGLFVSNKGVKINADVNGGYNIIRKSEPKAFKVDGVGGCGLHPKSISLEGSV